MAAGLAMLQALDSDQKIIFKRQRKQHIWLQELIKY
jgi:hypothetical protein